MTLKLFSLTLKLLAPIIFYTTVCAYAEEITLFYPENNATEINRYSAGFIWKEITVPEGLTVTFDLYVGTDISPSLRDSGIYDGWMKMDGDGVTMLASAFLISYESANYYYYLDNNLLFDRQTTYYWKVVAKFSDGSELASQVYSFMTEDVNYPPSTPTITYPANGTKDVQSQNLTIKWNESTDVENDPITYKLYLGTVSDNMQLLAESLTISEYTVPFQLEDQGNYKIKVVAVDGYDNSETIATSNFTAENYINDPPEAVVLSYPANNAINTTFETTLRWQVPNDKDGDKLYYDVYLDENVTPTTLIASDIAAYEMTFEAEHKYTTYYWKVIAKDHNGGESESQVYSFKPWKNAPGKFVEMVKVEGGSFSMGQPNPNLGYTGNSKDEQPVHTVNLDDFLMGKYEITWGQLCDFLNTIEESVYIDHSVTYYTNRYMIRSKGNLGSQNLCLISVSKDTDYEFPKIYYSEGAFHVKDGFEDYPAENMLTQLARLYCKWTGGRLPTEAEWEYAANGGNKSNSYTYSGSNTIGDVGWYFGDSENPYNPMVSYHVPVSNSGGGTHEVGSRSPNELGIYDMTGNVSELVNDWYQEDYYSVSPTDNPQGPETMPTEDPRFTYRGGDWSHYYYEARNCKRFPVQYFEDNYMKNFRGFRMAFDAASNSAPSKTALLSPSNNMNGISASVMLTWQGASDPEGDLVAYDVYFGKSSSIGRIIRNTQNTSLQVGELEDNTTYYWKVVAKDNKGNAVESDIWSFNTSTISKYTFSGTVLTEFGTPLANVELLGLEESLKTDANGNFSVELAKGWSGTIRAFKLDYKFSPEKIEINDLQQNLAGIAITAIRTYRVTLAIQIKNTSGQYMNNVEIIAGNSTINYNGYNWYVAYLDAGWSAVIKPVLEGYTFSPAFYEVNTLEEDLQISFTGTYVGSHTISGTISDGSGNPLSGVTLSGFSGTVLTAANGNFTTTETKGWSGTITPQMNGYIFSPANKVISSLNADITQDFEASPLTSAAYSITFNITDGSNSMANAEVALNGATYISNSNGEVIITNIQNGTYNYTVTSQGFEDKTGAVTVADGDVVESVAMTKPSSYSIVFGVTDGADPIVNAVISFNGANYITDADGQVTIINIPAGSYSYTVSASGFDGANGTIVVANSNLEENVTLTVVSVDFYSVTFIISDGSNPISNADITFDNTGYISGSSGEKVISDVKAGTYTYTVTAQGFEDFTGTLTVTDADVTENVNMTVITAIKEFCLEDIRYYPNPVVNILTIEMPENSEIDDIEVCNTLGESVYKSIDLRKPILELDLSKCQSGVLFIKLRNKGGNVFIQKLIKL